MSFKSKIEQEYPLPFSASIWGNGHLTNFDELINLCVDDLASDLEIYETTQTTGITTYMPKNTRAICAVWLTLPYQGNRFVKWSYDSANKVLFCRYLPCFVKYKRSVSVEDLETLTGDRLQYVKSYVIMKMLEKEISYLSAVELKSDDGQINVSALEKAREKRETQLAEMKDGILLYSNG